MNHPIPRSAPGPQPVAASFLPRRSPMGSSRASFAALFLLAASLVPCVSFAQTDTVSVGFLATSADPNKVHLGGVWDFDTPYYADDISGTDSSQFWTFVHSYTAHDIFKFPTPQSRPFYYYDWGNNINSGDH